MDRRLFLKLSSGIVASLSLQSVAPETLFALENHLRRNPGMVVPWDPSENLSGIHLALEWKGDLCRCTVTNRSHRPVRIKEVVLFEVKHDLPGNTALYGESFQMLSQTAGTLDHPIDLGDNEAKHYRIPQPADATVVTGLVTMTPPVGQTLLMAYTSCHKFIGRFYLRNGSVQAVVDTEGLTLGPGESWHLEELMYRRGSDRNKLLAQLASRINHNHPSRRFEPEPTGWCSYYALRTTRFTAQQVLDNLDAMVAKAPQLRFAQIDDGFQPWMGDWLDTKPSFGEPIGTLMRQIKQRGLEPAIWIGPFIADPQSNVFQLHPDWFIKDDEGKPLQALRVTFSGWGRKDWYALDGTNPAVQAHFERIFRYMREEWDCRYFKLDANFWGAMQGGHFHDQNATRIEAYRRGMEAIRRGAGDDSFLLGCNHPIWPSFGLIQGSRSSGDIKRTWSKFSRDAWQTLHRNWQNGRLWWNDPDAVCLTGDLTDDEFRFHATAAYASGGIILSGDEIAQLSDDRLAMLKKLLPPTGVAAVFDDLSMQVGRIKLDGATMIALFNRNDQSRDIPVTLPLPVHITDYWTGENLGEHKSTYIASMPPHSGRLLRCT